MTLADGDPFVVGDIFSFQQAERIKDNWRAAAAPSNPQPGSLWSKSTNDKLFHYQTAAYKEILQVETQIDGYVDLVLLSTLAAGGFAFRIDAYQDDTTGLTGLLRGAYIQASNGDIISTGTIRALELKARAGRPGEVGNDVAVLEGLSISADAKVYDITTVMRGAEVILDGAAGASIVKAVGIRIAQNFQADIATLCYGLEIYRDSFDYDADIVLSSGGLIGGKSGRLRVSNAGNVSIGESAGTFPEPSAILHVAKTTGAVPIYVTSDEANKNLVYWLINNYIGTPVYAGFGLFGSDNSFRFTRSGSLASMHMVLNENGFFGVGLVPTANMPGIAIEAGLLTIKERATPTADVNYGKIYTKNDNKLYFQDGAGAEHEVAYVP